MGSASILACVISAQRHVRVCVCNVQCCVICGEEITTTDDDDDEEDSGRSGSSEFGRPLLFPRLPFPGVHGGKRSREVHGEMVRNDGRVLDHVDIT